MTPRKVSLGIAIIGFVGMVIASDLGTFLLGAVTVFAGALGILISPEEP